MKKSFRKFSMLLVVILVVCIILTPNIFGVTSCGKIEVGASVVGNYSSCNCQYGDIVTINYATQFINNITEWFHWADPIAQQVFFYQNSNAWDLDVLSKAEHSISWTNIDDVDLMIYSGHGVTNNSNINGNSFHYSTNRGNYVNHAGNCTSISSIHVGTGDVSFGKGSQSKVKWVIAYTCNFLNSSTHSGLPRIMQGLHLCMGYNSTVWIVAGEGGYYGEKLRQGSQVRQAWFDGARAYQPTGSSFSTKYPRVLGANRSREDTIFNYSSKPNPFGSGEQYYYWTITIQ